MIQVELTGSGGAQETQEYINEWLSNRANQKFQVLDIQYSMASRYGYTSAMIVYDDEPTSVITDKIVQLPKYRSSK